jgi:hypothetical protein
MNGRALNCLTANISVAVIGLALPCASLAQSHQYPDKIRGYKVERTVIEVKRSPAKVTSGRASNAQTSANDPNVDELIGLGKPALARVTPLGITFEVPVVVAPVTQSGKVDFLVFEDMEINGRAVNISDYEHSFHLPNDKPLTLKDPLRIYIYLPSAILAAIGESTESKDTWPVTGRIYVFGKFKKGPFSFKRCIPVELDLTMRNPLKEK